MNLNQLIQTNLVGKTLTGLEFGINEPDGREATVPQRIVKAQIGCTEGDRDPCIWMTLENGERVYAYDNETIYLA